MALNHRTIASEVDAKTRAFSDKAFRRAAGAASSIRMHLHCHCH